MIPIPSSRSPPGNRARLPVERRVESGGEFVGAERLAKDGGACGQGDVARGTVGRIAVGEDDREIRVLGAELVGEFAAIDAAGQDDVDEREVDRVALPNLERLD